MALLLAHRDMTYIMGIGRVIVRTIFPASVDKGLSTIDVRL